MNALLLFFLSHLFGLTQDLFSAQAIGDRGRFLDAIRKLRTLLGNVDPSVLAGALAKLLGYLNANPAVLDLIKKFIGAMTVGGPTVATAHAMEVSTLSADDYKAAGIFDDVGGWMGLVKTLLAIAKLIWGPDVIPFSTTEQPRLPLAAGAEAIAALSAAAATPAPAAPIDANATA